jgi:hypothetical protein
MVKTGTLANYSLYKAKEISYMKLKSVVASMLALGVASTAALAASTDTVNRAEFDAMKDQVAKMEAVLNQHQTGLNNQTATNANDWFNRVALSGDIGIDAFTSAHNSYRFDNNGGNTNAIELPQANLFVDAQVNDWVKAHAGIHLDSNVSRDGLYQFHDALYGADISNKWLEEAYVTVANFAQSPAYARVGREYIPFGSYDAHAITPSLTQMLTQTRATALQAGVVMANGFNASAYTFNGTDLDKNVGKNRRVNNFGLTAGYANSYNNVSYNAGIGYIYNMADVNYISAGINSNNRVDHVVGGISVDGTVKSGPFDASAHYVTALKDFDQADVSYVSTHGKEGAKPSAWGIDAGYSFAVAGHDSRVGLGYQRSSQTNHVGPVEFYSEDFGLLVNSGMPQQRYVAQYDVNVWKNTDIGVQVYHDRNFDGNQGNDNNNTTGLVRLSVKLA